METYQKEEEDAEEEDSERDRERKMRRNRKRRKSSNSKRKPMRNPKRRLTVLFLLLPLHHVWLKRDDEAHVLSSCALSASSALVCMQQ